MKRGNAIFLLWILLGFYNVVFAIIVDAGEDQTVFEGATTVLGGSPTASEGKEPYTYVWKDDNDNIISEEANPMLTVLAGTNNYCVDVTDGNGISCSENCVTVVGLENQGGLSLLEITFNTNHPVVDDKDNTIEYSSFACLMNL